MKILAFLVGRVILQKMDIFVLRCLTSGNTGLKQQAWLVFAIFTEIITNYFSNWQVTTTDSSTNFFVVLKLFFIMGPLWLGINSELQAVFLILTTAIFRRIFLAFVHISIWPREHLCNKTCPWPPSNVLGEITLKKDHGCWSFFIFYIFRASNTRDFSSSWLWSSKRKLLNGEHVSLHGKRHLNIRSLYQGRHSALQERFQRRG